MTIVANAVATTTGVTRDEASNGAKENAQLSYHQTLVNGTSPQNSHPYCLHGSGRRIDSLACRHVLGRTSCRLIQNEVTKEYDYAQAVPCKPTRLEESTRSSEYDGNIT